MSSVMQTPPRDTTSANPMVTEDGRLWADRINVSDNYFKANSRDWKDLRALYSSVYEQRNRWGTSVSIAWSIMQTIVEDSIPQLPEPWIMARQASGNQDLPKMLRDLGKTILKQVGAHDKIKRARILCGYSANPCLWPAFEQVSMPLYANGNQDPGDEEEPVGYEARQQLVRLDLRSGWDMRYDPQGREWDLSDHKWVGTIYNRSLQACLGDPHFTNKDILERWVRNRMHERRGDVTAAYGRDGYVERDVRYQDVELIEIWSRVEHKIIQIPRGARFHVAKYDWPEEWAAADRFPGQVVALAWEGDDEDGKKGFYAVPDLRLVRSHLENVNRLEGLYLDAATLSVKKYFYPAGIFDDAALEKIQSDVNREFISIDWSLLQQKLGVRTGESFNPAEIDIRSLIMLMPTESAEEALKHKEAINSELEMIYQITGQSPADRGGAMATAKSATQALQIGQGQQRRLTAQAEQIADIVDRLMEAIFILLKAHQTLPLLYQTTGDYANESTWQAFMAEDIEHLDLVFYHRTGSSQPLDRDAYRFEVREVISNLLPILSGEVTREMRFLIQQMLSTYDIPGLDKVFADFTPQLVQAGLTLLSQIEGGQVDATDPQVSAQLVEIFSQLLNQLAGPADIQKAAQASAPGANNMQMQSGPTQSAPLKNARSAGQLAAQAAASGQVGGIN